MTDPGERRVDDLLAAALERDTAERSTFLDAACAGDVELRLEVESLIRAHREMGDFLAESAPARLRREPAPPPLKPGERVGAFVVERVIGRGGGGTVYEAVQDHPHRRVALKVLRVDLASESALRRFRDEAEILARLSHPGVEHVYEAGVHEAEGTALPWFAMEHVEGARTLTDHAEAEGLGERQRLALFADVCDAVHHGHQRGVLHGDLKPGNVLVDVSGRPKIIDFGVARALGAASGDVEVAGTLPYMSPEQLAEGSSPSAGPPDVRSDVFALGVLLHRLLTGRLPESGRLDPSLRGDLRAIVAKAVAPSRDDRYGSAAALAEDVRRRLAHRPVDARAPSPAYLLGRFARRHPVAFPVGLLAILALGAFAVFAAGLAAQREREREAAEFRAYVADVAAAGSALRVNDVAEARWRLDQAPPRFRDWEWRHVRAGLDASRRTVEGPRKVAAAAFSTDGSRAVSASTLKEVVVSDVATGRVLWSVARPEGFGQGAAFSLDLGLVVVGRHDGHVEAFDGATGELRWIADAHLGPVNAASFSGDGTRVATGGRDRKVAVLDARDGRVLRTLEGHEDRVISVAFGSGSRLVSGGREGVVRVWDADTGETVRVLRGHGGSVDAVAVSPRGDRAVSGSRDFTGRVWDLDTGASVATLAGHLSNVRAVAVSPDGAFAATASFDRTVRVWDLASGRQVSLLRGSSAPLVAVAFAAEGTEVASISGNGTLKTWDAAPREEPPALRDHADLVRTIAFDADGRRLVSGSRDGTLRVWDLATRRALARADAGAPVTHVELAPDLVVAALLDGTLRTWTFPDLHPVHAWKGLGGESHDFAVEGGRAWVGAGRHVWVADLARGTWVGDLPWEGEGNVQTVIGLAGGRLAVGASDGTLRIVDREDGAVRAETRLPHGIVGLDVGRDGATLAVASEGGALRVLDARTLATRRELAAPGFAPTGLAFSPSGTRLATSGRDGSVRLWDVARGEEVAAFRDHPYAVWCVAFDRSGDVLASGDGGWEDRESAVRLRSALPAPVRAGR